MPDQRQLSMNTRSATNVSELDVGLTRGSLRYALRGTPSIDQAPYCPRNTYFEISPVFRGRMDLSNFTFSSRIDSVSSESGGSFVASARTCKRWFCTMSRNAPA